MRSESALIRAVPVRVKPVTLVVAAAISSIAGINTAIAEISATSKTAELVVTATRRDTSVQDIPYSISGISGADIEALQISDLSGIAKRTPGLYQIDQGNRDANQLVMRGINASGIGAPELLRNSQGDKVAVYYGETPVYINLVPVDLERVETLFGPQGILFGARSVGGAIRYIPNKPDTQELSGDVHARLYGMSESDDQGVDMDIVVNVPIVQDVLAFRASLASVDRPGFIDQPYLVKEPGVSCPEPFKSSAGCTENDLEAQKDTNDEKTLAARFGLLWNISDRLEATLGWQFQEQEMGGQQISSRDSMAVITDPDTGEALDIGKYASGMRFLSPNKRTNNIYNLTFNYQADSYDFVSTSSYNTYKDEGNRDQTDLLLLYGYGDFPAFSAYTEEEIDDEFFTQEFRVVSTDNGSKWDWLLGAYFSHSDQFQGGVEIAPGHPDWAGAPLADDIVTVIGATRATEELAMFGEIGYQFTDAWHVTAGARVFDLDDDIESCFQLTDFDPEPVCDQGDGSDDDVIFKLGTDYRVSDDLMAYALFSQGFSNGGVNTFAGVPAEERFVKPEQVDNYEIGVKSSWLDNRIIANATIFYMDWTDLQFESTSSNFLPITGNGSGAESKGIELFIDAQITDNWSVNAGYTYAKVRLTDSCVDFDDWDSTEKSCPIYAVVTKDGDRLPGSPEKQGTLGITYETALRNGLDLTVNYWLSSQSDVYTELGNGTDCCRIDGEKLPGFTVHYATVALDGDSWTATLFANNLFNKYAVTGVRDDPTFIGTDGSPNDFALRRYYQNIITPRVVGIDLRYKFK